MKLISYKISLTLILISCNNKKERINTNYVPEIKTINNTKLERGGNEIDYDNTKVLYSTFIIEREGSEFKEEPNIISKTTLGTYEYGKELEVIEVNENWLGIRDRITRELYRNGNQITSSAWEKVYVLKSSTGPVDKIKLLTSDLNIISSLTKEGETTYFEKEQKLNDYLSLELIDKELFNKKKNNTIDYLISDTLNVKKENGVIKLKCEESIKEYIDKPDAEESRQEFEYVGQIDFLNQFVIAGSYWESSDYTFIDKKNGNETQVFGEYPNISPNKDYIICLYANPYEMTTDIEIYLINKDSIKQFLNISYKNWMPSVDNEKTFWHTDGYLYTAINHIKSFWTENGNLNDSYQYLRIKIL